MNHDEDFKFAELELINVQKGVSFRFIIEGFTEPLVLGYSDFKKAILFKMNQQVQEEENRTRMMQAQQNVKGCYDSPPINFIGGGLGLGRY